MHDHQTMSFTLDVYTYLLVIRMAAFQLVLVLFILNLL